MGIRNWFSPPLKVWLRYDLAETPRAPTKAHEHDAGWDLYASHGAIVTHEAVTSVGTGISVDIPKGYVGLICPRSGLASQGITVVNSPGIIDCGYSGEIRVLLHSVVDGTKALQPGDRIAQLVLQKLPKHGQRRIKLVDSLADRGRGAKGFGSSGR